jgi:hypothetical protein
MTTAMVAMMAMMAMTVMTVVTVMMAIPWRAESDASTTFVSLREPKWWKVVWISAHSVGPASRDQWSAQTQGDGTGVPRHARL